MVEVYYSINRNHYQTVMIKSSGLRHATDLAYSFAFKAQEMIELSGSYRA